MICEAGRIIAVPYPFIERPAFKVRPALVVSDVRFNAAGNCLVAMITTAAQSRWPEDYRLQDLEAAGLPKPSVVRFKIFTLSNVLIERSLGRLSALDAAAVQASLNRILAVGV